MKLLVIVIVGVIIMHLEDTIFVFEEIVFMLSILLHLQLKLLFKVEIVALTQIFIAPIASIHNQIYELLVVLPKAHLLEFGRLERYLLGAESSSRP